MKRSPLSRKDFLKLSWASLWGLVLAACGIETDEETPTPTPTATNTSTPEPEKDSAPTVEEEPTATNTPTETPLPCFKLLTPEDGAKLGTVGRVAFTWEDQLGAKSYKLKITLPNEYIEEKFVETTIFERYLESLPLAGEYHWQITALNENESIICVTEPFSFKKEKISQSGGNNNGGDSTGGEPGGGPTPGGGPSMQG